MALTSLGVEKWGWTDWYDLFIYISDEIIDKYGYGDDAMNMIEEKSDQLYDAFSFDKNMQEAYMRWNEPADGYEKWPESASELRSSKY